MAFDQINAPRLIKQLSPEDIALMVGTQLGLASYLLPTEDAPPAPDHTYDSALHLWDDVLARRLPANTTLRLDNFLLYDWFPRSPGLYYTDEARAAREEAMHFVERGPEATPQAIDDADPESLYPVAADAKAPDYTVIFNPYGKLSMLRGGVGSVRLQDKPIREGTVWFMTASSSPVAHEGFPVALPDPLYRRHYDQIASQGFLSGDIIGKLRYVPRELTHIYRDYTNVPRLYLLIEEFMPANEEIQRPLRVSVAVTFVSEYEAPGWEQMYAAYVTFFPQIPGSFERRIRWLEQNYVQGRYQGRIVTDFDERESQFREAVFSLDKVMNGRLSGGEVERWLDTGPMRHYGRYGHDLVQHQTHIRLHTILCQHYTLDEFKTLCFRLNVLYDHLAGEALPGKARDLILRCQEKNQTPALIAAIQTERPQAVI